ncbi:plasmid partitioning protein RepA [Acidisphaera sp. L21]|uniref:plasmid partitioning protein RepA n=1 Tax=Acidisphaera sp. L21 TaxID=1641851 RepID=UPI00131D2A6A|nr:plasmid partitioning protein RepA [Acidisphaera sp. L21]
MRLSRLKERLQHGADVCQITQQRIVELENVPDDRKRLRQFPTTEAASLLGVSESYLRQITKDGAEFTCGTVAGNNYRRTFSLKELHWVLAGLHEKTGDERYRRRRNDGEKLQVLAVANFKGGAAKTTTAVHLGQYLALRGYRVLLVDLDSQASLTSLFGLQPDTDVGPEETLYPVFRGEASDLKGCIRTTYWPRLDLVPANLSLGQAEFEMPVRAQREKNFAFWLVLREAIENSAEGYDVVVLDCPPSLGFMSINAIFAATGIIVPVPPSMIDFASTGQFFRMCSQVLDQVEEIDPNGKDIDFFKILIAKHSVTDQNQKQIIHLMAANFGDMLLQNPMAVTTALDAAGLRKRTYYEIDDQVGTRQSYLRGLSFLNAVNAEIEGVMLKTWGRQDTSRAANTAAGV